MLPVIWKASEPFSEKVFLQLCQPRLEVSDSVMLPDSISLVDREEATKSYPLAEGTTLVKCSFSFNWPKQTKDLPIVISYRQPAIDGSIHYLPLFEEGDVKRDASQFTFTAFPTGSETLSLDSTHKDKVTAFKTRITVTPAHKEPILIRAR